MRCRFCSHSFHDLLSTAKACAGRKFSLRWPGSKLLFGGLSDGVTVAQGPLEAFVLVRIQVGQPPTTTYDQGLRPSGAGLLRQASPRRRGTPDPSERGCGRSLLRPERL